MLYFKKPIFIKGNPDVKEHVLRIANDQGWFVVSLQYRDEWLVTICDNLVKQKLLTRDKKIKKGQYVYYPRTNQ